MDSSKAYRATTEGAFFPTAGRPPWENKENDAAVVLHFFPQAPIFQPNRFCLNHFTFHFQILLLHGNRLTTLRQADKLLPRQSLTTLTLNDNRISELADLSHLSGLSTLEQLTLAGNPCLEQPEELRKQFDHRPYVINWCLGLRVLDGVGVGAKERWVDGAAFSWSARR